MVRRSCLLSSPFSVHTAGERPIGAVPFRRAVAWQGVLLVEPSRDAESPAGGTAVNLAMSARLLGLTRTKKKKKKEEVTSCSRRLFLSSLKGPVSFKCFRFLDEVYNFTFLYISLKKQNKTKLWSHCKRNQVLAFFSRAVTGFREFCVLIPLQSVGRIPQSRLWGPAKHLRKNQHREHQWFSANSPQNYL